MIPRWFWWQEGDAVEHAPEYLGSLCSVGKTAVLQLEIVGHRCEGLLDTGASRSFIRPTIVERLGLKTRALPEAYSLTIANGEVIHIDRKVPRLSMLSGGEYFTGDFLIGPIPYSVIIGIDWLVNHKVAWYFQSDKLRTYVKGRWCDLPVLRKGSQPTRGVLVDSEPTKTAADHAYDELARQVARMTAEEVAAFLRPPSKRYKPQHRARGRVKIKDILRQARKDTAILKGAIQGLNCVVVLPVAEPDRLQQVLDIFLKHQFYQKLTKCKFGQQEPTYPGYTIGAEGIKPAADKVEAIHLWPEVLANETQVRQFLGMVNYCRMFMGLKYADTASPLVELTRKNSPFVWREEHSAAVRQLKRLLEFTTLQVPDSNKPYTLYTYASGYAIGAVLEQEGKPVGFLCQVMTPTQQKYSIYDQELLALISTVDKWRHLLRAAKVTAYTDHQALTYLRCANSQKSLRGRTARWLDFLAEFPDLTISYLQGAHNKVADALSRHPQHAHAASTTSPTILVSLISSQQGSTQTTSRYLTRLSTRTASNTNFQAMVGERPPRSGKKKTTSSAAAPAASVPAKSTEVTSAEPPASPPKKPAAHTTSAASPSPSSPSSDQAVSLTTAELASGSPAQEHLSPQRWEDAYLRCSHFREIVLAAAHHNEEEFFHQLQGRRYTFKFCRPCLYICVNGLWRICPPTLPEFLSHILYRHHEHVTAGHRGERKTFLSLSKLYYWPGMRAYTTAYVEPCVQCRKSKASSQNPAGLLQSLLVPSRRWSHVSLDSITDLPLTAGGHDCILVIVNSLSKMAHFIPTKNSATTAYTIEVLADRLIRYHGFPDVLISDRDPRFQSQLWQQLCQRFHIKRAVASPYHRQSDGQTERVNRTLEQMLRTYIQTNEREWERLLPALELAYNTSSHSSTELSPFGVMNGQNPVTAADLGVVGNIAPTLTPPMTKLFQELCDRAQSHILKAKWQQKRYADAHGRDVQYNPGDRVWISSRKLPGLNQCSKFEPRFRGPFTVLERIGQVAYRIELPPTYPCHNVFHVSQLVPDRPRDPQMKSKEAAVGWLPVTGPGGAPTDTYEVDYILNQRGSGKDTQYLVKWRGAPEDRATWEPAANLTNCPVLLRAWRRYFKRARDNQRRPQDVASRLAHTTSAGPSSPMFSSQGGKEWSGTIRHYSQHKTA